jgi:plasmid stability protein
MSQLLVRGLDTSTIARLKERARRHGRSLQSEVKAILEASVAFDMHEARDVSAQWQRRLAEGIHSDSTDLIREDRER